jgi:Zn-finger nucleic acid-binding protein
MNCPRCSNPAGSAPLHPQQAGRLVMHCCFQCGGLFLDGGASRRVVEVVDPGAMATAEQVSRAAQRPAATDAVAPCPVCARALDRLPIPAAGVVVDACSEHGVWFDRDELQRVVQAVATPAPASPGPQNQGPQNLRPQNLGPQNLGPQNPAQPYVGAPQPYAGSPQPYGAAPSGALAPGMAPGQYVAPGWLDDGAQKPFGGVPSFGAPVGQSPPGAPAMPGQPGPDQGWSAGKTALAVGGGLAAVAGVAYVASHTNVGRQAMGLGPHQSGFGAVGDVLSKLF